mgnify:CR=1 FL=1
MATPSPSISPASVTSTTSSSSSASSSATAATTTDLTKGIVLFTTVACGHCHKARSLLQTNCIQFTEINLHYQAELYRTFTELSDGHAAVPFVVKEGAPLAVRVVCISLTRSIDRVIARSLSIVADDDSRARVNLKGSRRAAATDQRATRYVRRVPCLASEGRHVGLQAHPSRVGAGVRHHLESHRRTYTADSSNIISDPSTPFDPVQSNPMQCKLTHRSRTAF